LGRSGELQGPSALITIGKQNVICLPMLINSKISTLLSLKQETSELAIMMSSITCLEDCDLKRNYLSVVYIENHNTLYIHLRIYFALSS
jgi:hypothetical protein